MKKVIKLVFCILMVANVNAQKAIDSSLKTYDAVISFNSICCGTPSADFLKKFLNQYGKKNKIAPEAWLLGGCGREGEFKVLLSLSKMKNSKKVKFNKSLKVLIPNQNSKNKTLKPDIGSITLTTNFSKDIFTNCSAQLTEWKF